MTAFSLDEIEARIATAGRILAQLPPDPNSLPKPLRAGGWPEYLDPADYWRRGPTKNTPIVRPPGATPEQIDLLTEVLGWFFWLTEEERHIAGGRIRGKSWRQIRDHLGGASHEEYRWRFRTAVARIARKLNGSTVEAVMMGRQQNIAR